MMRSLARPVNPFAPKTGHSRNRAAFRSSLLFSQGSPEAGQLWAEGRNPFWDIGRTSVVGAN